MIYSSFTVLDGIKGISNRTSRAILKQNVLFKQYIVLLLNTHFNTSRKVIDNYSNPQVFAE